MDRDAGVLPVVEAGTPQPGLVQVETEGPDEVQACTRVGTKSYDIAGIGRNLGLVEHDVYHLRRPPTQSMDKTL